MLVPVNSCRAACGNQHNQPATQRTNQTKKPTNPTIPSKVLCTRKHATTTTKQKTLNTKRCRDRVNNYNHSEPKHKPNTKTNHRNNHPQTTHTATTNNNTQKKNKTHPTTNPATTALLHPNQPSKPRQNPMRIIADLHIHGRFSRATSERMSIEEIARYAKIKGLNLVGTGDFTHPKWLREIRETLAPDNRQRFIPRCTSTSDSPVRFMLTTEVCTIFDVQGQSKKVHHVIFAPSMDIVEQINAALERSTATSP